MAIGALVGLFLCQVLIVVMGGEWGKGAWISFWILVVLGISAVLGALGFWTVPEHVFRDYVKNRKREAYDREVERLNAHRALDNFEVDLERDTIEPR